jgi:hypothetical protein
MTSQANEQNPIDGGEIGGYEQLLGVFGYFGFNYEAGVSVSHRESAQ